MSHVRVKNGKISPILNEKGIVIAIPVIIIEPDDNEPEVPMRPKVHKPAKEDTGTIYCRMAESIVSSNSDNTDDGSDGFCIGK